ncbi:Holliday junction resolvase RuvX [bacterium]|nr:Holliday junction resolvase RuvX [bacterium]
MSIIGLDIGDKTIGISVSDPGKSIALGLKTLKRENIKEDLTKIKKVVDDYKTEKIVLGYPKNMDGSIGKSAQKVLDFEKELKSFIDLETVFWDERLTTLEAEKLLIHGNVKRKKRREVIDTLSAVLILQNYLDYYKNRGKI